MKLLIIEDEQLGFERLVKLLNETNIEFRIVGHTVSIKTSVQWLMQHPAPDLIFMDIELADGQCFEIFNQLEVPSPIIFTTSYDEYALHAFKVNSIDYLLKPIRREELERSLKKYNHLLKQNNETEMQANLVSLLKAFQQKQTTTSYRHRFLVKQGQRLLSVEVNEIAWFHAEGKICFLKTWDNHRYLLDYTLEELDLMLDPDQFFRVNRGYIIHHKAIRNINNFFNGKLILSLQPTTEENDVIISKGKAGDFKRWLGK